MPGVSIGRIVGAAMIAAFAGVATMIAIFTVLAASGDPQVILGLPAIIIFGMIFGLPIALGHILILGLPAWLLIDRWRPIGRIGAAAIGLVIGTVPVTIFGFANPPAYASTQIGFSAAFGAAGVVAALAFLKTLRGGQTQ